MKPLAPFASDVEKSLGRLHPEAESPTRTAFARDRDRIIHSTAFRRLKGKTQVFVANEGDYFRTRLTHSLEVAQIARSLAHSLSLNEDLAETIALSHDLGHPPFGHAGEDQLHECMKPWGGFDHNVQTFRVITRLEVRYPAFDGLNLTWETLEGIIKHNGPVSHHMQEPSWKSIVDFNNQWDLRTDTFASMEAQCAALADDIAYNNHDVDDGLRAELFTIDDLMDIPLIGPALASVQKDWPAIDSRLLRLEGVRRMIGLMMSDVLAETARRLKEDGVENGEDVRTARRQMVAFSKPVYDDLSRLRGFLFERMYKHYRLNRTRSHAKRTLKEMFGLFMDEPDTLPTDWFQRVCSKDTETARARVICDYIAGMTDAFAIEEQRRLFSFIG
jgi:dGTPase